ncbi:MAG TPA: hypothetical protein VKB67_01975 [Rhizomicrobium sp.]|nr:hypothetical protein [Rhizomicrobium sp.]
MPITAEAFDGSTHEFPDNTPPEKIRDVIGQYTMQKRMEQNREVPKAAARGVLDLAGDVWDTLSGKTARELTSYIERGKPKGEEIFSPSTSERLAKGLGVERGEDQGTLRNMGLTAVETMANPSSLLGPGSALTKLGGAAVSGGLSEAAGEVAHFIAPKSKWAEPTARVIGGAAGGYGAGAKEKSALIREGEAKLKGADVLKEKSQQGYADLQNSGISIPAQGMVDLNQSIHAELAGEHFTPTTAPRTFRLLHKAFRSGRGLNETDRVNGINAQIAQVDSTLNFLKTQSQRNAQVRTMTAQLRAERQRLEQSLSHPFANAALSRKVSDVMDIHAQLGHIRPDVDAADANAAQIARSTLREWLENHAPEGTTDTAHQAIRDWAAHKQIEEIEDVMRIGQRRAEVSGSGFNIENTMRQEIRKILDSKKLSRGKSDAWKRQAERVVKGSVLGNLARAAGRTTWINSPASTIAALFINAPLAAGLFVGTHMARKLGEVLTEKEIEQLITTIQEEAPSNKYRAGQNRKLRRDLGHGSRRTGFHPSRPEMGAIRGATTVGESPAVRDVLENPSGIPVR